MEGLGTFIAAVLSNWVAIATGGLSLAIYLWNRFQRQADLPWATLVRIWVGALLVGSFLAWQAQHTAWKQEHATVEEMKRFAEPALEGTVRTVHWWVDGFDAGRPLVGAIIQAEIVNLGHDSIAHRYKVTAAINGKRYPGELYPIPERLVLREPLNPQLTQVVYGKDELRELTAVQPIKRGGKAIGALLAWFGKTDSDPMTSCSEGGIELEAKDAMGRTFKFESRGTPQHVQAAIHLPGLTKQTETPDEICKGASPFRFGLTPVDPTPR